MYSKIVDLKIKIGASILAFSDFGASGRTWSIRTFVREILRHMRQKPNLTKTIKNRAFSAENSVKMPQNQCFSYIFTTYPFVTNSLKSATSKTSQFFSQKWATNSGSFCIFKTTNCFAYSTLRDLPHAFQDSRPLPSLLKRLLLSYHWY